MNQQRPSHMTTAQRSFAPSLLGGRMQARQARHQGGLSLVEVMVTLLIGMVVTLGVFTVTSRNSQNLRVTEGLSESQENVRMAFELIARDLRQARDTGCGPVPVTNNLTVAPWNGAWWPVRGFGAGDYAGSVAGTQALQLMGSSQNLLIDISTITAPGAKPSLDFLTSATPLGTANGWVIVCDLEGGSLHRVTGAAGKKLNFNGTVTVPSADNPQFMASRATAVTWYIGDNGRPNEGGRSLFRVRLTEAGAATIEEILPGVVNMEILYHRSGGPDFVDAATIGTTANAWATVNAIQITLTTETTQANLAAEVVNADLVGTDGRLRRQLTQVIALRSAE